MGDRQVVQYAAPGQLILGALAANVAQMVNWFNGLPGHVQQYALVNVNTGNQLALPDPRTQGQIQRYQPATRPPTKKPRQTINEGDDDDLKYILVDVNRSHITGGIWQGEIINLVSRGPGIGQRMGNRITIRSISFRLTHGINALPNSTPGLPSQGYTLRTILLYVPQASDPTFFAGYYDLSEYFDSPSVHSGRKRPATDRRPIVLYDYMHDFQAVLEVGTLCLFLPQTIISTINTELSTEFISASPGQPSALSGGSLYLVTNSNYGSSVVDEAPFWYGKMEIGYVDS